MKSTRQLFLLCGAAAALVLFLPQRASAALITAISRSGSALTPGPAISPIPLDEDVLAFNDRNHQYNGFTVPNSLANLGLVGAEYIRPDNDDRASLNYQLTVTLGEAADLYLAIDNRVGDNNNSNGPALGPGIMEWVANSGFVNTTALIGVDEVGTAGVGPGNEIQQFGTLYVKQNVPVGNIVLGPQDDDGTPGYSGSRNMYGVLALPAGSPVPTLLPPNPPVAIDPPSYALIDLGATGGRADFGAAQDLAGIAQIGAGPDPTNLTNLAPRTLTSNTGDQFSIAIDNVSSLGVALGGLDWRDRGDGYAGSAPFNQPLVRLGEDHVKNNAGIIHVTLDSLPAGYYEVLSFHLDAANTQSDNIRILVDNGNGLGYVDTFSTGNANAAPGIQALSTEQVLQRVAGFDFQAFGDRPVHILFDATLALDTEVPLSGLYINFTPIPEPGTLVLCALGGLAVLAAARRRRRG
jgi:hypothetical protein